MSDHISSNMTASSNYYVDTYIDSGLCGSYSKLLTSVYIFFCWAENQKSIIGLSLVAYTVSNDVNVNYAQTADANNAETLMVRNTPSYTW